MATFSVVIPQAQCASAQTIFSAGTGTAISTSTTIIGPWPVDFFSSADITTVVTTCSAAPLQIWLQKRLPDGLTFDDIACLTTLTSSTEIKTLSFVNGGNTENLRSNLSLASGTVLTVHFGSYWRIVATTNGTAPSCEFGIYGDFRA